MIGAEVACCLRPFFYWRERGAGAGASLGEGVHSDLVKRVSLPERALIVIS